MSNFQVKDGTGSLKYLKSIGTGTDEDPYSPVQDVNVQDATNKIKILPFRKIITETTLTANTVVDERTVSLTSTAGMTIGDHFSIQDPVLGKRFDATIIDIIGSDVIIDTPMCKIYTIANAIVAASTIALNVNGDTTQEVFSLRTGTAVSPNTLHITRLMINIISSSTPIISDFGDIADGLLKGVVLRHKDGEYFKIFNIKSNFDIASLGYDIEILQSVGVDGIRARVTFAGQEKMGAVLQLLSGEDLELIVQDDLTGLVKFEIYAQGHIAD
jgi:hypothetical protein